MPEPGDGRNDEGMKLDMMELAAKLHAVDAVLKISPLEKYRWLSAKWILRQLECPSRRKKVGRFVKGATTAGCA